MSLRPGLRVVRGPDWQWKDQDGGEGHLGTVISFDRTRTDSALNRVDVRWDRGLRGDYRMGFGDAFDLRIFDNSSVGDHHCEIRCTLCSDSPIQGIRWKCETIYNLNLCSSCYHGEKTYINHRFYRIVIPGAKGVLMPKRSASVQTEVKGLFPGAKVLKGSDLKVTEDDRKMTSGILSVLCDWEEGFRRTGAIVDWSPWRRNTYRIGYMGKMDLKTKEPGSGGLCYLTHLPVLGERIEMESVEGLMVGDHVTILLDRDVLRTLQQGHGDWVSGMAEDIGQIGVVRELTSEKDIVVEYPSRRRRWIFHPAALTKIDKFELGESVRITNDVINILKFQMNQEELESLRQSMGKLATIVEADEDAGSFRIQVDNGETSDTRTCQRHVKEDTCAGSRQLIEAVSTVVNLEERKDTSENIAIHAAQGRVDVVRALIQKHPEWVNVRRDEKSPLQLAAHGGHLEVVMLLVDAAADIDMQDEDGDSALMFATNMNHCKVVEYLIAKEAKIDMVNSEHRSALHQAVMRGFVECIQLLINNGCNVNIQDNCGDTALHDAISSQHKEVLSILISHPSTNFELTNHRQYNALQWAALNGSQYAVHQMISRRPVLAGIANRDGFTALHIAAMKNFPDIVRILTVKGECDVDSFSMDHHTPLLIAVQAGHVEVTEVLLTLGADVNKTDADGDTSLHMALLRQIIFPEVAMTIVLEKIQERIPNQAVATSGLALACLLVQHGANLDQRNKKGQTPLQLIPDTNICSVLRHFVPPTSHLRPKGEGSRTFSCESDVVRSNVSPLSEQGEPSLMHSEGNEPVKDADETATRSEPLYIRKQQEKEAQFDSLHSAFRSMRAVPSFPQCRSPLRPPPEPTRSGTTRASSTSPPSSAFDQSTSPLTTVTPNLANCRLGCGNVADAQFSPCGHINVCLRCSECFKLCHDCWDVIQSVGQLSRSMDIKTNTDPTMGQQPCSFGDSGIDREQSQYLDHRISKSVLIQKNRKLKEQMECGICIERKKEYVFLCGHVFCKICTEQLHECPMCRGPVLKKIKMYL